MKFKCAILLDERFDYASKLKSSMEHLRKSGELLAKYQLEKQIAANREDFEKAKEKKMQMDSLRESLYKSLRVKELLEPNGVSVSIWNFIKPLNYITNSIFTIQRIPDNDEPGRVLLGVAGMTRSITELSLPQETMSVASTPGSCLQICIISDNYKFSLIT